MNYYNENDPFAAQWLRNLIAAGLIASGDVDERSITEVRADDLKSYTQCHFFAGIGGWSYALRLAGWPDERPVWTGSCPCQPFSSAGNRKGKGDERHLWPVWFNLIRECRPATIFGEQVSSAIAHGWLDDVYQGLEGEGYAVGSAVLPACSVGAPHKRDRLWFVADSKVNGWGQSNANAGGGGERVCAEQGALLGNNNQSDVADATGKGLQNGRREQGLQPQPQPKLERLRSHDRWETAKWLDCPDGKQRLVEPGVSLLAHGVPNRVGKLRGYGNAIVPQVAQGFIESYLELEAERIRMIGPCAKTTVVCTLVTPTGKRFVGTNYCNNAQALCPRLLGEGYEKCRSVCQQAGHAEIVALDVAGAEARGSRAYIEGHTYACQHCQEALFAAGVLSLTIGPPPSEVRGCFVVRGSHYSDKGRVRCVI